MSFVKLAPLNTQDKDYLHLLSHKKPAPFGAGFCDRGESRTPDLRVMNPPLLPD